MMMMMMMMLLMMMMPMMKVIYNPKVLQVLASLVCQTVGGLLGAGLIDRQGRKPVLRVGSLLFSTLYCSPLYCCTTVLLYCCTDV